MSFQPTTGGFLKVGSNYFLCTALTPNSQQEIEGLDNSGFITPTGIVMKRAKPIMTFTTVDTPNVLVNLLLTINSVSSNNVTGYILNTTSEGMRGSCTTYGIAKGALILNSLTCSQGGIFSCSGTVYATSSDGQTDPFTVTENSVSLPTLSPLKVVQTIGTVAINGTQVSTGNTGFNISLNNDVILQDSNGNFYATYCYLGGHKPVISIENIDGGAYVTAFGNKGVALNGTTGLAITLNGSNANGVLVSGATNTITMKNGMIMVGPRPGSQGGTNTNTVIATASTDLTNAALIVS